MAGHPRKVDALDGTDHRHAERFARRRITRTRRRLGPIGQSRLDRLDQDIGTVIGRSTILFAVIGICDLIVM